MGASPPFFGAHPHGEAARTALLEVLHRSPRLFGLPRSRWWLAGLRQVVGWLAPRSLSGIWRLLQRLRLHYKRGRRSVHSPDPDYDRKLRRIRVAQALARRDPQRYVFLYEDELSYYRRPTVACAYVAAGRRSAGGQEPLAAQGVGKQRYWRIAGALDVVGGLHHAWQRAHFDRHTLLGYFRALEAAYPKARRMFIALDNWPVHTHADVLAGLQDSRVRLLPLPTYAPWTNPEEKVWRKLYAEVLHLHDFAERWPDLRPVVQQWLDTADTSPTDLLRYVGLLCPN